LDLELQKLNARQIVIEADCDSSQIRLDGMFRSDARLRTGGIVISFQSKAGELRYPCDTYLDWQDNVRAIALSLEALRAVDRHGVTSHNEQYTGWAKLPAPTDTTSELRRAADLVCAMAGGNIEEILINAESWKRVRTRGCSDLHPDRTGNDTNFKTFMDAAEILDRHHGM